MLYEELDVSTVVCLSCGAKVAVDKLIVVDVDKTTVPDEVAARGGFFQIIACPKCKKGVYFGFLIDLDSVDEDEEIEEAPKTKKKIKRKKKVKPKKEADETINSSSGLARKSDGTIIIDDDELPEEVEAMEMRAAKARREDGVKEKKVVRKKKPKKQPHKPNRAPRQKAECSICHEVFETGDVTLGAYGSRCPKCMRQLKSKCGG